LADIVDRWFQSFAEGASGGLALTMAVRLDDSDRDQKTTLDLEIEDDMTREQKQLVQASFMELAPVSEIAARFFYNRLFELNPRLRLLFKGEMHEQGRKLMQMIGLAVRSLDHPDTLIPTLQGLGQRHSGYGVKEEDYEAVGAALIATLEAELGSKFTPETRSAWVAVYDLVASVMQQPVAAV
jgi:hemoglobin-like flavoprotein